MTATAPIICSAGLFAAGRNQEVVDISEAAIEASGEDYNVYVPIINTLGSMGRKEARRNMSPEKSRSSRKPLETRA